MEVSRTAATTPPADRPAIRSHRAACGALKHSSPGHDIALCTMVVTAAAVPAMRHFAADHARLWAVPAHGVDSLSLVVTELVANAVLHSGSTDVTVLLTRRDAELVVEVRDTGHWLPGHPRYPAASDPQATCGRGLELVRHVTTWCTAFLTSAGTRVVACVPVAEGLK
ncbi:ATP-binding protein [Streptomyces sp. NPDC057193]|uniref:ATP-binding protein n=1 Tax=Streptomyces sp. NPDC057193 TaxID=3346043 RepID=UPI00362CACC4